MLAQFGEECGFSDTLLTVEDKDGVMLCAGANNPGHRCYEGLAGDGSCIRCIFCAEVINKQCVDSRNSVPFWQAFEVFPNRMISTVVGNLSQRMFLVSSRECAMAFIDESHKLGCIDIPPRLMWTFPGQFVTVYLVGEAIMSDTR